jgi:uroporphyrinogen-III synthase
LRVLITRPEPDASRTAERLARVGHEVLIDSLLSIEPFAVENPPAGEFAALAATSANAARIAAATVGFDRLRDVPLYAVGAGTAEAARRAGFAHVVAAEGDARALARMLTRELGAGVRVLHLAGEDRAQELGPLLAPAAIAVDVLTIYRARAAERFSAATVAALQQGELDAVLHFSPRSAATFVTLAGKGALVNEVLRLRHYCLSSAVAAPLKAISAQCEIAARPIETELLASLKF